MFVHGSSPGATPLELGGGASLGALGEHLPNADLHVIAHCGHWTQIEQPERFQSLVLGFLSGRL